MKESSEINVVKIRSRTSRRSRSDVTRCTTRRCHQDNPTLRVNTLEDGKLGFNPLHATDEDACDQIAARQHGLAHDGQAAFTVTVHRVGVDHIAEPGVLFWKPILEVPALVEHN
jgi:hypothetical protein